MSGSLPFEISVSQWVDKAKANAGAAFQATAMDALARVKQLTPVKTGYLRANWFAVRGGDAIPVAGSPDQSNSVIAGLRLGDRVVLANPCVYALRIEFGYVGVDSLGRHYNQQGAGMMQQTYHEMPQIAARATARIVGPS